MYDFMVIGAQKSGTTSLFKYINGHPQLCLPYNKEAPFYGHPERERAGKEPYLRRFFPSLAESAKRGTITPSYLGYPGIVKRIKAENPNMKFIAILRDPVSRAISHYQMNLRRGRELRPVSDVLADASRCGLEKLLYRTELNSEDEVLGVIHWSSYKFLIEAMRIEDVNFRAYLYEDLEQSPHKVIRSIFEFIGVDSMFNPGNLDERYHVGGSSRKFAILDRVARSKAIRPLISMLPPGQKAKLRYWYEIWNTDSRKKVKVSERDVAMLKEYMEADEEFRRTICVRI